MSLYLTSFSLTNAESSGFMGMSDDIFDGVPCTFAAAGSSVDAGSPENDDSGSPEIYISEDAFEIDFGDEYPPASPLFPLPPSRKRKATGDDDFDELDLQQSSVAPSQPTSYQPVHAPAPRQQPGAAQAPYFAYQGHFSTSAAAERYRKRVRITPAKKGIKIEQVRDLESVKALGRQYWVGRIYEAMVDVSRYIDNDTSPLLKRFLDQKWDVMELEGTAHTLFDEVLAVYERGWNHPQKYHKKCVRGKYQDYCMRSVERRLTLLCMVLARSKALANDAVSGGIPMALLCDNPSLAFHTKATNQAGNERKAISTAMGRAEKQGKEYEGPSPDDVGDYGDEEIMNYGKDEEESGDDEDDDEEE